MGLFLDDLREYFISRGILSGEQILINYRPDDPDLILVLSEYDSSGQFGVYHANSRRVQFLLRNVSQTEAARKSWEIFNSLFIDGQFIIHINEDRFIIPTPLQSPFHLEEDDKERSVYVFNASIATNKDF